MCIVQEVVLASSGSSVRVWISFVLVSSGIFFPGHTAAAEKFTYDGDSGSSYRKSSGVSQEKRLTKHLIRDYKRMGVDGRPVSNASMPIFVRFGLNMVQMDLDEKQNTLTASVWCRYRWEDEFLTWDPDKYGGVKSVRLSSKKIWIPDIMLYNTADTHKLERDVLVVVSHKGSVLWIPHRIYHSSCSVDVTYFPFDSQTCHMTFGSWAYHGIEIDLGFYDDLERMDISDLEKENTEWEIISKTESRKVQYYDCCEEPYVTLIFTLALKRKLVFSSFILTLPCIFLACMTLVVFWLPPERPDRTSLAMSLFSCFLLLLLILVEAAPPTASSVPLLGVYYCFNMVLIMLSIFLSSVVINVSRRADAMQPVPQWLTMITFSSLSKIFCTGRKTIAGPLTSPVHRNTIRTSSSRGNGAGGEHRLSTIITNEGIVAVPRHELHGAGDEADEETQLLNGGVMAGGGGYSQQGGDVTGSQSSGDKASVTIRREFALMHRNFRELQKTSEQILIAIKEKEVNRALKQLRLDWQMVAMTLDRLFFIIFVIAIVLSLLTLFPRPYQMSLEY